MKRFPEPGKDASGNPTNGYTFFRPEILDIKPITIYRDKEEEIARAKAKAEKEALERIAAQKKEQEKLMLAEKQKEAAIHKRIKAEFAEREEKMKSMIELTKLRTQKELVKSKFNPSGIEDSMETLLSSLKTNVEEVESLSSSDDESIPGLNSKTDLLSPLASPAAQGISIIIEEQDEDDNTTDNSGNNV